MARIAHVPIPTDDKAEALACIAAYKAQNPIKYEQKKAALFAKYGLDVVEDSVDPVEDDNDKELKAMAKKLKAAETKAANKVKKEAKLAADNK